MDWDDLRYVLAVAREGSALRAGRLLGVNQTTVLRRLDALECDLGSALFERSRGGQALTETGQLVADTAERMEREAEALKAALAARDRTLSGSVRVTTSDTLANRLVTPCLRAFRSLHPDITIELITDDARLDVARGEADVALRAGSRPEGAGIVARRLPDAQWTVYCSRAYAAEHGAPRSREEIPGHEIVGMDGRMAQLPGIAWLAASAPEAVIRFRSNSLINLASNLKAGLGLGALPTIVGDSEPELVRCFPPPAELDSEMWLIVREELKGRPHVRAFTDFLARYIRETVTGTETA
ncbi:LysR family transcriptional regulator [Phenylobacterium sp.]|uniref:LysR family transcriptional regulator n=1 Tax=Phenylobacterium sp. TaxID=1871053 RepID=UPI002F93ABA7